MKAGWYEKNGTARDVARGGRDGDADAGSG